MQILGILSLCVFGARHNFKSVSGQLLLWWENICQQTQNQTYLNCWQKKTKMWAAIQRDRTRLEGLCFSLHMAFFYAMVSKKWSRPISIRTKTWEYNPGWQLQEFHLVWQEFHVRLWHKMWTSSALLVKCEPSVWVISVHIFTHVLEKLSVICYFPLLQNCTKND